MKIEDAKIVISGAGAAGTACTKLLLRHGAKNVIVCDRKGVISEARSDINEEAKANPYKIELARITNPEKEQGSLASALEGANIFIGVSAPGLVTAEMVKKMAPKAVVFAMANPMPEIMPEEAKAGGAYIIGTGRSDFPNQINNVLVFPGIFRGVLDARLPQITEDMKIAAALALADLVKDPTPEKIIAGVFEDNTAEAVAKAVMSFV
jgi:malate dehydrogenase (oxaloacetate-decarboxylating)